MSERKLINDADYNLAMRARSTLADESKWIRFYRNDFRGHYCVVGHLELALGIVPSWSPDEEMERLEIIATKMGYTRPPGDKPATTIYEALWGMAEHNNSHTHAEVLARFDEGLNLMKKSLMEV